MFVKVLDPNKAKQLKLLGFKYTVEKLGKEKIYVFQSNDDLMKELQTSFSKADFFIENTLNF